MANYSHRRPTWTTATMAMVKTVWCIMGQVATSTHGWLIKMFEGRNGILRNHRHRTTNKITVIMMMVSTIKIVLAMAAVYSKYIIEDGYKKGIYWHPNRADSIMVTKVTKKGIVWMAKLIKKGNYWPMHWNDSLGNTFKWSNIAVRIKIMEMVGIFRKIYLGLLNKKCMGNWLTRMINKTIDSIIIVHKSSKRISNVFYQKITDSITTTIIKAIDNVKIERWINCQHRSINKHINRIRIRIRMELVSDQKVRGLTRIFKINLIIEGLALELMILNEGQ